MCSAHHEREDRNPFNSTGLHGPLIGTGSFKVLDALSCYLRLILRYSDTKLKEEKNSQSRNRGGTRLLRPHLDPPLQHVYACMQLVRNRSEEIGFNQPPVIRGLLRKTEYKR